MARRLDGSDKGVLITQESARRIQRVVQRIEGGDRNIPPVPIRTAFDEDEAVRLGTIAATWFKGDDATVTQIKGDGTAISPTVTFTAKNWFSSVIVTTGTKKVACAKVGEWWLLIAAECA